MFNIECVVYLSIIIYSLIYQLRVIITYKQNKKVILKDATGLYVAKEVLNDNELGTLYVTKVNGKYNDHYDIERNVIRLSEDVYDESNLSSLAVSFYETIKAIKYSNIKKRKEEKIKNTILDYVNKVSFVLFIIGASSKGLDIMTLSLVIMIIVIIIKYRNVTEESEIINKNIDKLKKEYKLKKDNVEKLDKHMSILLMNELSLHIFNNKY